MARLDRRRGRIRLVPILAWLAVGTAWGRDSPGPGPLDGLRAGNLDVRRGSAARLGSADRATRLAALPALIDILLKEKDGQVRLAAFDVVTGLGRDAAPAIPALLQTLRTDYGGQGKEESHQDYRSAIALAAIGGSAVDGLRGLLKERKEGVRAEVIMALGRIGPDAGAAVPDLIPLLGDKGERIRREATVALGRLGPAAIGPLVAASSGDEPGVRARATEALGTLPVSDDRIRRALLDRTADPAPAVRAAAIRSLPRAGVAEPVLVPILRDGLRSEDDETRLATVDVLTARRDLLPGLGPDLAELLVATHDGVARHAAYLLGKMGRAATPLLLAGLRDDRSRIGPIAEALAEAGRSGVATLVAALQAPEPRVRRGAALALGQTRPTAPETLCRLVAGLADADPEVRAALLAAIGQVGPRAEGAALVVPAVRAIRDDRAAPVRLLVVEILTRSAPHDPALLGDLTPLLDDPDPSVSRRSIEAVRDLGPVGRSVLQRVVAKLTSAEPSIRLAALEFVESHGHAAVESVPGVLPLLSDPVPKIRTLAAQVLGKLGKAAQPGLPRLIGLLQDGQVEVREAATLAIGGLELPPDSTRPHLARGLGDEKTEVRRAALRVIGRAGTKGAIFVPDLILMAARKEDQKAAERALRPFERGGLDARSVRELVKILGHEQVAVRLLAIKFLGIAGQDAIEAIPALGRLRDDPDPEVRARAAAASDLIRSGPGPAPGRSK